MAGKVNKGIPYLDNKEHVEQTELFVTPLIKPEISQERGLALKKAKDPT